MIHGGWTEQTTIRGVCVVSTVARETFRAGEDLNALDPARYAYQHSSQGLLYAVRSQFAIRLIHPARVTVQARSKAVAIRLTSAPR